MSDLALSMGVDEARTLTDQAKRSVDQASSLAQEAVALVEQVISRNGHRELGYSTPAEYLHVEFNVSALPITPDERREMALMLVRNGVSKRGAARALGVDDKTVRKDLSNADRSALPDRVETSDGRSFPLSRPAPAVEENFWDEPGADEVVDAEVVDEPARPEPSKPKRRPLPEAFTDATHDFVRIAERFDRLRQDDRFTRNRHQTHHRASDIVRALDSIAQFAADMDLPAAETSEEARRWWATSLHNISDALTGVANSLEQEK
ncbi:hypothetical protein QA860_08100 [Streptomyces stelliscabiei]|uniref:hypothetical protein n=1 Tax=Streptomyces stelliscabiei TaxID=146820 RepID=UPI002FEECE63